MPRWPRQHRGRVGARKLGERPLRIVRVVGADGDHGDLPIVRVLVQPGQPAQDTGRLRAGDEALQIGSSRVGFARCANCISSSASMEYGTRPVIAYAVRGPMPSRRDP